MRVEDFKNSIMNNDAYQQREYPVDDLAEKIAGTLDRHGSRRLNGYGWCVVALSPSIVIPAMVALLSYPLAEQSPLSRMTKRVIEAPVYLDDGSFWLVVSSSRGNPRKPGDLTIEVNGLSRLHIARHNSTEDLKTDLTDYNSRYGGFFSNNEKWINSRPPSLEVINVYGQLMERMAQLMEFWHPHLAPAH